MEASALKNDGRRRKTKAEKPAKPEWTAESFTEAFIGTEPKTATVIKAAAKASDVSGRQAQTLLEQAEAEGLAHRWRFGSNQKHQFATAPQPEPTAQTNP